MNYPQTIEPGVISHETPLPSRAYQHSPINKRRALCGLRKCVQFQSSGAHIFGSNTPQQLAVGLSVEHTFWDSLIHQSLLDTISCLCDHKSGYINQPFHHAYCYCPNQSDILGTELLQHYQPSPQSGIQISIQFMSHHTAASTLSRVTTVSVR